MEYFTGHYIPDSTQYRDWRASPLLHADLANLPPALVLTAGYDPAARRRSRVRQATNCGRQSRQLRLLRPPDSWLHHDGQGARWRTYGSGAPLDRVEACAQPAALNMRRLAVGADIGLTHLCNPSSRAPQQFGRYRPGSQSAGGLVRCDVGANTEGHDRLLWHCAHDLIVRGTDSGRT